VDIYLKLAYGPERPHSVKLPAEGEFNVVESYVTAGMMKIK
jgi:hypothetical protein